MFLHMYLVHCVLCHSVSSCVILCLIVSFCVFLCHSVSSCVVLCLLVSFCVFLCHSVSSCFILCLLVSFCVFYLPRLCVLGCYFLFIQQQSDRISADVDSPNGGLSYFSSVFSTINKTDQKSKCV